MIDARRNATQRDCRNYFQAMKLAARGKSAFTRELNRRFHYGTQNFTAGCSKSPEEHVLLPTWRSPLGRDVQTCLLYLRFHFDDHGRERAKRF